jgi:hypothetical protein
MSESSTTLSSEDCQTCQQPSFRGCVFCYSAEWVAYGLKRAYSAVAR